MEEQCLSGLHQERIGSAIFSFAEAGVTVLALGRPPCRRLQLSFLRFQVGLFFFFLFLSAIIWLDVQPMGLVVLGVSLGGGGGFWRFWVARPLGTSGLQARRDWVVPACRVAMESSLRCLYPSGPSPLTFKAPVPKLIYLQ